MKLNYKRLAIIAIICVIALKLIRSMLDSTLTVSFVDFKQLILASTLSKGTIYSIGEGMAKIVSVLPNGQTVQTIAPFRDVYVDTIVGLSPSFSFSEAIGVRGDILDSIIDILVRILFYSFLFSLNFRSVTEHQEFIFTKSKISFDDVGGLSREKKEIKMITNMLNNRKKYIEKNISIPKGLLFFGPPGNGKTMMAKAIAHEADVNFISVSGSEFDEIYVGLGPLKVRNLFNTARKNKPAIIFIDEIDSIGKSRSNRSADTGTLNQLLCEIDGFKTEEGIMVIAATNLVESLDKALLRAGRLDVHVKFNAPSFKDREEIAKIYMDNSKHMSFDVMPSFIAEATAGFSASKICQLINMSVISAVNSESKSVNITHISETLDRILLGIESSITVSSHSKIETAIHEVGHMLTFLYFKTLGIIDMKAYKVSIVPRSYSLGVFMYVGEQDIVCLKKVELEARICITLGGFAAERIYFGEGNTTTGVGADLESVSSTLRRMYMNFGMYDSKISNATSGKYVGDVEQKISSAIDNFLNKTISILNSNKHIFDALVKELIQNEEILGERIEAIRTASKFVFLDEDIASSASKLSIGSSFLNNIKTPDSDQLKELNPNLEPQTL